MTDLSVVIASWNTRDLLLACLDSIGRTARARRDALRIEVEVLVVDNGSGDGTPQAVRERHPWARVIELGANRGFAAACNAGLRRARGRHVLLLNSDCLVTPGALEACVRFLDGHPEVGVVGPQLFTPEGAKQNSIHNIPRVATELLPKGLFQFLFRRRFPSSRFAGREPIEVEAVSGAALCVRRDLIADVGPLPEDYFFFLEETDWCWRIRRAGWRIVHLPDAHVFHLAGGSSKRKHPALTRIEFHRSLYRFYRKNRGAGAASVVFSVRLAKALFYVVTQAPLALVGGQHRRRWSVHRQVVAWHLRGCPAAVGLAGLGSGGAA